MGVVTDFAHDTAYHQFNCLALVDPHVEYLNTQERFGARQITDFV